MRTLLGFITALTIPLALLNMLGGVVSGIWLGILGEWSTIGLGILFFLGSTLLLGIVLLPSILLAAPAAYCAEKGKTLAMLCFGALSNLYTIAVITVWCCGVLYMFVKDANSSSLVPKLIWSYGVAIGPWSYMASKEPEGGENLGSVLSTFLAELAYVVVSFIVILFPVTVLQALKVFAGFMLVGLAIQMTVAYLIQKEIRETAQRATGEDGLW
jgi:hypothetical protein